MPLLYFGSTRKKSILGSSSAKKDQKKNLKVSTEGKLGCWIWVPSLLVDFKQTLSKWTKLKRLEFPSLGVGIKSDMNTKIVRNKEWYEHKDCQNVFGLLFQSWNSWQKKHSSVLVKCSTYLIFKSIISLIFLPPIQKMLNILQLYGIKNAEYKKFIIINVIINLQNPR